MLARSSRKGSLTHMQRHATPLMAHLGVGRRPRPLVRLVELEVERRHRTVARSAASGRRRLCNLHLPQEPHATLLGPHLAGGNKVLMRRLGLGKAEHNDEYADQKRCDSGHDLRSASAGNSGEGTECQPQNALMADEKIPDGSGRASVHHWIVQLRVGRNG